MKREDWYNSTLHLKLRLLNNIGGEIKQKTQQMYDLLNLVLDEKEELMVYDKFTIVERQLRVTDLEIMRLNDKINDLYHKLSPRDFDDINYQPPKPQEETDVPSPV